MGVAKTAVKPEDIVSAVDFLTGRAWFRNRLLTSVSGGVMHLFLPIVGMVKKQASLGVAKIVVPKLKFRVV